MSKKHANHDEKRIRVKQEHDSCNVMKQKVIKQNEKWLTKQKFFETFSN